MLFISHFHRLVGTDHISYLTQDIHNLIPVAGTLSDQQKTDMVVPFLTEEIGDVFSQVGNNHSPSPPDRLNAFIF